MGFFDFLRRGQEKVYGRTEVTKALEATLPLWNDLNTKYSQTPRMIYERNSTEAAKLANGLEIGIRTLLNGLAGAQRRGQEVDPKEKETLQQRLKNFQIKKGMLDNLIATGGVRSRR